MFSCQKNSTFITQPLDAGIIKSFKAKYFHYLISSVLSKLSLEFPAQRAFKTYNVRDAIIFSSWARTNVSWDTIINCWKEAGYNIRNTLQVLYENVFESNDLQNKINQLGIMDPVESKQLIYGIATENELIQEIADEMVDETALYCDENNS